MLNLKPRCLKITTAETIAATVGGVAVGEVLRFPLTALVEGLYQSGGVDSINGDFERL